MSLTGWFNRQMGYASMNEHSLDLSEELLPRQEKLPPDHPRVMPRLAAVRTAPSREEFAAWRADPTTEFVMAALHRNAEENKEKWLAMSWGSGIADQSALIGMRARSDALLGFTAAYEDFCAVLGLDPEPMSAEEYQRFLGGDDVA